MTFLRKWFNKKSHNAQHADSKTREDRGRLEQKAIEGAHKALKEYRRVFERLAEYDRA